MPAAFQQRVRYQITELIKLDIIEKVSEPSLVPIIKYNGDLRLCIDMRRANVVMVRENPNREKTDVPTTTEKD